MARDIISEIFEKRSRHTGSDGIWKFTDVLDDARVLYFCLLDKEDELLTHSERQFIRALPVLAIAAMEAYVRRAFALIVDSSDERRMRLSGMKDSRLSFDVLAAVGCGRMTVGEFASHILSFKRLDEINSQFSKVIGVDIFSKLQGRCNSETLAHVARCIEVRNIIAHEAPLILPCTKNEALVYFRSVIVFVFELDNAITREVGPLVIDPRSERP